MAGIKEDLWLGCAALLMGAILIVLIWNVGI